MKLFMHICCAPCAVYPVKTLKERGISITGFWFNPNIHPFTEYSNRLGALKKLESLWGLNVYYRDSYDLKEFLRNVAGKEDARCSYCYMTRLEATAQKARETNADAFTTSLLVSPYQKFDVIGEIGKSLQEKYAVEFLFEDFREEFSQGRTMAKKLGLYRQKYCGCIYSEMERFYRPQ